VVDYVDVGVCVEMEIYVVCAMKLEKKTLRCSNKCPTVDAFWTVWVN